MPSWHFVLHCAVKFWCFRARHSLVVKKPTSCSCRCFLHYRTFTPRAATLAILAPIDSSLHDTHTWALGTAVMPPRSSMRANAQTHKSQATTAHAREQRSRSPLASPFPTHLFDVSPSRPAPCTVCCGCALGHLLQQHNRAPTRGARFTRSTRASASCRIRSLARSFRIVDTVAALVLSPLKLPTRTWA